MPPTVLLIGGGHVNLHVATEARSLRALGARVVLVDPGNFWYSGLATGLLGGRYAAAEDQIDLRALLTAAGGEYICGSVGRIDPRRRCVHLADGAVLSYDLLSLNVGSRVNVAAISGAPDDPTVWPVKPVSRLWQLRLDLEARLQRGTSPRIAVVGGGPTGVEIAANILALCARHHAAARITVLTRNSRLLPKAPAGVSRSVQRQLAGRGVTVQAHTMVMHRQGSGLVADDGRHVPADVVIVATGLDANPLIDTMGLPVDNRRGLIVDDRLQAITDDRIFAGGDVAAMAGFDLPKLGVFGVRQAPVVHANLRACLRGTPLVRYRPQKRSLAILDLGDGTALSTWGPFWWRGRSSMWLKERIDRRFLAGYRSTFADLSR